MGVLVVVYAEEAEIRGSQVRGQPRLHNEFQVIQGDPVLKNLYVLCMYLCVYIYHLSIYHSLQSLSFPNSS